MRNFVRLGLVLLSMLPSFSLLADIRISGAKSRCEKVLASLGTEGGVLIPGALEEEFFSSACSMRGGYCRPSALQMALKAEGIETSVDELKHFGYSLGYFFSPGTERGRQIAFPLGFDLGTIASAAKHAGAELEARTFPHVEEAAAFIVGELNRVPPRAVVARFATHDITIVGYHRRRDGEIEFTYHDPVDTTNPNPPKTFEKMLRFCLGAGQVCAPGEWEGKEGRAGFTNWERTQFGVYTVKGKRGVNLGTPSPGGERWNEMGQRLLNSDGNFNSRRPGDEGMVGLPALNEFLKVFPDQFVEKPNGFRGWFYFGEIARFDFVESLESDIRLAKQNESGAAAEYLRSAREHFRQSAQEFRSAQARVDRYFESEIPADPTSFKSTEEKSRRKEIAKYLKERLDRIAAYEKLGAEELIGAAQVYKQTSGGK